MSFSTIKPYFQEALSAVHPDLKEWEDAFNLDNIPSSVLDKSWHIRLQPSSYVRAAHTSLLFRAPVTLSICFKGYRNPKEAVDTALEFADAIIKECTNPVRRLNQPKIKNVLPGIVDVREMGTTNDNVCVLELSFNCDVIQ